MKRRLQFSVASLLAIVTVSALVAQWYATRHRVAVAQYELGDAKVSLELGMADDKDVYNASIKLIHAEHAVPFANRRDAFARHLELMETLENRWRARPHSTTRGGDPADFQKECDEMADKIHVWVEEAQRWLDEAS